jgi:hypothetical protein
MSNTEPTAKSKRTRAARQPSAATRNRTAEVIPSAPPMMVSAEQRRAMIAEAAYLRAERRGFEGGDPVADWLESEREVDALLTRSAD